MPNSLVYSPNVFTTCQAPAQVHRNMAENLEKGAGCLEQPLLAAGLREEVLSGQGWGHGRETSTEVQAREQAGRQREVGCLEVEVWAGGRAPHPVCLGKAARTASPVEANGQAGGASQRHRVRQEEGGTGGFDRGLATPQRFSTRGSQRQHQLGAEKV